MSTQTLEEQVNEFIRLRREKFEGIIEQHADACGGEIGQLDIADYFEAEIRDIEKVIRLEATKVELRVEAIIDKHYVYKNPSTMQMVTNRLLNKIIKALSK